MEQSMKKHAVKRTIRYWGCYVVKMFFVILLMAVIYGVVFARGETRGIQQTMISVMFYVAIMESIMILVLPMTYVGGNFPLVVSMGSGRKEAFWGIQFANLLFYVQTVLALSIGGWMLLCASEVAENMSVSVIRGIWMVLLAGIFLLVAMGQIGAWLSLRYGMKGNIMYTIGFVVMLVAGAIGVGFFVANRWEIWASVSDITGMLQIGIKEVGLLFLVVALILYSIGFVLLKRTTMHYEVQR